MDTRFWGPSGWRLLHLITFAYIPSRDKAAYREFFEVLPFILPCKFCRSSLTCYYEELPLEQALASQEKLTKWLWKIHNQVNAKLRNQGQTVAPDPPFAEVRKVYMERFQYGCTRTDFPGWEFLFSVAENHPFRKGEASTPMPKAPPKEQVDPGNEKELCKWNYLAPEVLFGYHLRFWRSLGNVLPFREWRSSWLSHIPGDLDSWKNRGAAIRTLWKLRCAFETDLELLNQTSFHELCNDLKLHRSGCSSSKRARTCRRRRSRTRSSSLSQTAK
jgi:hypothetical protein